MVELRPMGNNKKKLKKTTKQALLSVGICTLLCFLIVGGVAVVSDFPYAVNVAGKAVCYVEQKEEAETVMQKVIESYIPEGTTLKTVETEGSISVKQADIKSAFKAETVDVNRAVEMVRNEFEVRDEFKEEINEAKAEEADDAATKAAAIDGSQTKEDILIKASAAEPEEDEKSDSVGVKIVSTGEVTEKFKAKTEYIKDDTMLAGESVIEEEGSKGERKVLRQFTSVNGEVIDETDLNIEIIKDAKAKVIRKGTLGLPDGEDWKTYDGDPIYKDGDELVKTALNYLGAPYKYGGKSLTTGIDCVQFIRQMYAKYGISLPNGKHALKRVGTAVSFENAMPGDIICYSDHYAIYLGDNKIVHATSKGGVKTRNNAKFRKIVTIRRIVKD